MKNLSAALIVFSLTFCFSTHLRAQCYETFRQDGIDWFNKGEWAKAKAQFQEAANCKSDKPANHDLKTWIGKCDQKIADAAERARRRKEQEEAERLAVADDAYWEALKGGNKEDCENYLQKYPEGRHSTEARERKKALAAKKNIRPQEEVLSLFDIKNKKSGLSLKLVEGGTFEMGSPDKELGRGKDECPHTVKLNDFQIGIYEVTQADWFAVMGSNPPELSNKACDECPVEGVSWEDIQDFFATLNAKLSPGHGKYRLPTEAEWEFAARGGTLSKSYTYAGGNQLDKVAWFNTNAKMGNFSGREKTTRPVGGRNPNELGLFDMSGNVWEWCSDEWTAYPGCSVEKCEGCAVLRGGSWNNAASKCRPACRLRYTTTKRTEAFGFRCAMDGK